ncbi:MAG: hypothetical protein R3F61_17700 [Myxococcota bacterium]
MSTEAKPAGVCIKCGADKPAFDAVCSACGHRPADEGLLVAWLLSDANLGPAERAAAARRIASGESIRPSAAMLKKARRALGRDLASDPGLTVGQRVGLLACSLLLTPLVGWTCWFWLRRDRPRAALQSLALSLPPTALLTAVWVWLMLHPPG